LSVSDQTLSMKKKLETNPHGTFYVRRVQKFKRMTPEYHKSLIKMDGKDSPYNNSIRLNKTIQLLSVTDVFEMTDKGKPYAQYTLFIRNSDWAEPME